MRHPSLLAACTIVLAAAPLAAQGTTPPASSSKGIILGVHLNGSAITADDLSDDRESGGGLNLQLGYGFTPKIALVLDATAASLDIDGDDVGFAHFDVLLRYAFTGPTRRFVPFLEGGFSGRALAQDNADLGDGTSGDLSLSGGGFTFGGGAQYYIAPKWAIGAGLKWTIGEFSKVTVDDVSVDGLDLDATSARFNIGLTWYPMAGR
jgi:opacity protein-like surface antigen